MASGGYQCAKELFSNSLAGVHRSCMLSVILSPVLSGCWSITREVGDLWYGISRIVELCTLPDQALDAGTAAVLPEGLRAELEQLEDAGGVRHLQDLRDQIQVGSGLLGL